MTFKPISNNSSLVITSFRPLPTVQATAHYLMNIHSKKVKTSSIFINSARNIINYLSYQSIIFKYLCQWWEISKWNFEFFCTNKQILVGIGCFKFSNKHSSEKSPLFYVNLTFFFEICHWKYLLNFPSSHF